MKKDNTNRNKKYKKYISLIVAPHFPGDTKTYKLRVGTFKLIPIALTILVTILICQSLLSFYLIRKVTNLTEQRDMLAKSSYENVLKLNKAIEENNTLQMNSTLLDDTIQAYTEKYREITEKYITSRLAVSRSNDTSVRTGDNFTKDILELKDILASLNKIATIDNTVTVDFSDTQKKLAEFLDALPTFWPTQGKISDKFGYRIHPISFVNKLHTGIDIAADYGTDIVAAGCGKVIMAGNNGGYGKCIIIDHGNGIKTLYAHADSLLVSEGQWVKKGELIAKVGSTGTSTGPHLHFEIKIDDIPIDPLIYLDNNN